MEDRLFLFFCPLLFPKFVFWKNNSAEQQLKSSVWFLFLIIVIVFLLLIKRYQQLCVYVSSTCHWVFLHHSKKHVRFIKVSLFIFSVGLNVNMAVWVSAARFNECLAISPGCSLLEDKWHVKWRERTQAFRHFGLKLRLSTRVDQWSLCSKGGCTYKNRRQSSGVSLTRVQSLHHI